MTGQNQKYDWTINLKEQFSGARGVLDPDFPWQNRPYPEIPLKFFYLPYPEFSFSSVRRVVLFSTESLIQNSDNWAAPPKILYKDMIGA